MKVIDYKVKNTARTKRGVDAKILPLIGEYQNNYFLQVVHPIELSYTNNVRTLKSLLEGEERRNNEVVMITIPRGFREQAVQAIETTLSNLLIEK